jgi:signal transduction histidine kinase
VTKVPTSLIDPLEPAQLSEVRLQKRFLPALARRVPVRTVRLRLSLVYGALFLVSSAGLLTITYLLVDGLPISPPANFDVPGHSANGPAAIAAERATVLHALLFRSGIALAIMAVISLWLGWLVAGRVLRPIRTIASATRRISEENLHKRLALEGPNDELKELGDTIDDLLSRLEGAFGSQRRAFEAQRAFVANASHELRTPLAMMRTSLDVVTRKSPPPSQDASVLAAKVRKGLDQADRLLEGFLVLTRAQRGVMADLHTVPLASLAAASLAAHASDVTSRRLSVRTDLNEADVSGNETLLARMVANVVDNAVRHNEPEGFIEVTTRADDQCAHVVVENGGPRLDQHKVDQLAEPFRRLGTERIASGGGLGLGLSIVAAIAIGHGGILELRARAGGGLRVTLVLPLAGHSTEIGDPV